MLFRGQDTKINRHPCYICSIIRSAPTLLRICETGQLNRRPFAPWLTRSACYSLLKPRRILPPEKSSLAITSAIDALQEAEQLLLKKAVNEYLFELCQLREHLIEKRQQLQQLKDEAVKSQSADWPNIEKD